MHPLPHPAYRIVISVKDSLPITDRTVILPITGTKIHSRAFVKSVFEAIVFH